MSRSVLNARLHLTGLMLVWAGWMYTTGLVLGELGVLERPSGLVDLAPASVTFTLTACAWCLLVARLPALARRGYLWPVSVVGLCGLFGLVGLILATGGTTLGQPAQYGLLGARAGFGLVGLCLVFLAPRDSSVSRGIFFLFSRQASDRIAQRSLLAAAGHALLVAMAVSFVRYFGPLLQLAAVAYTVGVGASLWQRYSQRAIAFIPLGWIISAIALVAVWIWPGHDWPVLVLAVSLGLGHTPPRNVLLANLPDHQRVVGLAIMALAIAIGAIVGTALAFLPASAMKPVCFAVAFVLAALAVYSYRRELVEQLIEPILAISYPIRGYGPGLKTLPTRGPILVYANHCAWLDPLWVAKLIPLRLKPMMTSKFYDKPFMSWLMRYIFHAIRVPDLGYRREAPEIHEAIAALERGESVLIFPEGWLKRKEEQSMRRFGQGIYQILREKPGTPVVACWIEGGWGSYMSYKGGPPTVNKKPDFLRLIRIGISEPEVLSLDLLHDGLATRRHLMLKCLHARTFLGLPELPPPAFAQTEESDETPENRPD